MPASSPSESDSGGLQLSPRFQNSFKTALAMVMAYGFALWFNWDRPMWAGFAVALISMPTLEASLNKGGQRLWGTLLAAFVALSLIAIFPQDRWLFMLAQAAWLAFCAYKMSGNRYGYFWFCAGFVTAIITANGGPDPVNAFSITTVRTLETSLGIVCFALVFSLLWPVRAGQSESEPAPVVPPQYQRLNQALQVFFAYCIAFLLIVFVPGFPGGFGFLGMLAPFAIILANAPQMQARSLAIPVAKSIAFATPIYFFVMPQLDGFTGLAITIFVATFVICYHFHTAKQGLGRTFGLAFFAIVTGISNDQTYSFLSVANTVLMFSLVLLVLHYCTRIELFGSEEDDVMKSNQVDA
jgi:uncharacterized membrane protein YccC